MWVNCGVYTFQTLSYTVDLYMRKIVASKDFISFASFVSFFPQLVAGPIERASNLLPQFHVKRTFNYHASVDGLRQILWGLFKKIVIANNCAEWANIIFNNSELYNGSTLIVGAFFFTIQIYCDFSGYSDIAIGAARLLGFNLMQNFAFPFFSRNIVEFWRRWHISLSTWFRDYVYFPLGGSYGTKTRKITNVFIVFLISGLWHGANWTFIAWGALNALFLVLTFKSSFNSKTVAEGRLFPGIRDLINISFTFSLTVLAFILFRSESIHHTYSIFSEIFSASVFSLPEVLPKNIFPLLALFAGIEWIGRTHQYGIEKLGLNWNPMVRNGFYYLIIILIIWFGGKEEEFIYFQF